MTDNLSKRILVVDDEVNIVSAVRRELESAPFLRYRYDVEGFSDPGQALERARVQRFDAVISDYAMPGMNGLEFLKALAALQPDCARLVLSGRTDMDALVRMVGETHIYRFIPKPWDGHHLKGALAQALDYAGTLIEYRRLANLTRGNDILVATIPERETERVLIVDDDANVLSALARVLTRRADKDVFDAIDLEASPFAAPAPAGDLLNVQGTESPLAALELARRETFACIVADARMPEMGGVELLRKFAELQPDCQRILISGQIGEHELIEAIESAGIFAFIAKPWADHDFKAQVATALAQRRLLRENRRLAGAVRQGAAA